MGWDCYATGINGRPEVLADFKRVAEMVQELAGSCDGLLEKGGLDCSDCAEAMHKALGLNTYREENYTVEELKAVIDGFGEWPNDHHSAWDGLKNLSLGLSAKAFIDLCVKHGLGIHFSF